MIETMGIGVAMITLLSSFALYQMQHNKETDRRIDSVTLAAVRIEYALDSHIKVSNSNQEVMESKINAINSVVSASLGLLDEKMNMQTELIKSLKS